ncbi:MAG: hypothetical protein H6814_08325 [Phycisphaeraceae bacterium]|nr:hypothetical protein [Phycisphaeraceae bacterium]
MSAAINHAEQLSKLLKKISARGVKDQSLGFDPIDQFVYSSLLWDSTHAKAATAFKRIKAATVDYNDFRVGSYEEIIAILGERYPRCSHRAERLRASLNDIYSREHAVSLESLKQTGKREARAYLDSLRGAIPFVTARVMLIGLDAHAIPIDERTHALLVAEQVIEEGVDIPKAIGILERAVKAADSRTTHDKLQSWSERNGKAGGASKSTKSATNPNATRKKTGGKKAATRQPKGRAKSAP